MKSSNSALETWKSFHWSFFVNTQGLIICLGRFEEALDKGDLQEANLELATAASLLEASGAAMELAGSFSRQDYENVVRPSMLPPEVSEDNFSGLMSWDHSTLIQQWKKLRPKFTHLPPELEDTHRDFVSAYQQLAISHRAVCQRFGGDEGGSIRNDSEIATEVLDRLESNRRSLIQPSGSGGCPMHSAQ